MTGPDEAGTRDRRRALAAVLLAGAGLFDALAAVGDVDADRYVVLTPEGVFTARSPPGRARSRPA